jgi:predicted GH43/DUF377 family glycosyl hydrolase/nucleotide-binding universal stress UspA family protein/CBS domain-containing protein
MTYVALGPRGPRIALAVSKDLRIWDRLGLLHFAPIGDVDFDRCDNKDCVIFPLPVTDPAGRTAFALLHRPMYRVPRPDGTTEWVMPPGITDRRPSIWISYVPIERVERDIRELTRVSNHQLLAQPIGTWDHHHIGSGAPPILSEEGWLLYYHGVLDVAPAGLPATPGGLIYQSGVMLLDRDDPRHVLYRSSRPVLLPQEPGEQEGIVSNVVFPTAVDVRGQRVDVYYGAADARIAVATTQIAASTLLAPSAPAGADVARRVAVSGGRTEGDQPRADGVTTEGQEQREGGMGMRVKDIMTQTVDVAGLDTTLAEAAERMRAGDAGILPVQAGDELIGVVTDRDLALRAVAQGLDPKTATVREVMTAEVHYCFDDESLEEAAGKMEDNRVRHLVVLDRAKRLTGVVSLDDVAAWDRMRRRYERILVAVDGSRRAELVLASIEPLARTFGSRVILLRVVTPAHAPTSDTGAEGTTSANRPAAGADPTADDTAHFEATRYLTAVQQRLVAQGLTVESECPEGPASEMILRRARQLGADLIALTTHGRTGVDRLLLGSVAEDVVRRATCPVHLVRVHSGH